MKKSFVISLILFFLITIFGGSVNAVSATVSVKANNQNLKVGDTVTVTVSFSVPVGTASLNLNYNSNVLQYVSSNAMKAINTGSSIKLDYIDTTFQNKTIRSMTVTFKAKAEGTSTCTFSGVIISDAEANELSASVILYTGGTRTMSVSIYTEVIRASYGTAAALSSILTLTTVVSLLIFFKVSGKKEVSL